MNKILPWHIIQRWCISVFLAKMLLVILCEALCFTHKFRFFPTSSDTFKLRCTEWIYTSDSHRKTITPIAKDYWLPTQNFNGHSKTYLYSLTILLTWTLANLILCTHGVLPSCSEATVLTRYTATWAFLESRIRVQRYMNFGISTFVYWMNHIVFCTYLTHDMLGSRTF